MKFLVFSDSHGSAYAMQRVLNQHRSELSGVLHLGDGTAEFRNLSALAGMEKLIFAEVCGNFEQYSMSEAMRPPFTRVLAVEGVRVLLTHGHVQGVSFGAEGLAREAREQGCSVALHGHTHIARHVIDRGSSGEEAPVEILCPGSIARPRAGKPSYGVLEIKAGQVMAYAVEI